MFANSVQYTKNIDQRIACLSAKVCHIQRVVFRALGLQKRYCKNWIHRNVCWIENLRTRENDRDREELELKKNKCSNDASAKLLWRNINAIHTTLLLKNFLCADCLIMYFHRVWRNGKCRRSSSTSIGRFFRLERCWPKRKKGEHDSSKRADRRRGISSRLLRCHWTKKKNVNSETWINLDEFSRMKNRLKMKFQRLLFFSLFLSFFLYFFLWIIFFCFSVTLRFKSQFLSSRYGATYLSILAGIIWLSGAASIRLCHVFVLFGMTKPNSKNHSSRQWPLKRSFCSNLNRSSGSAELKFISLDTARQRSILLGTRASCSTSGTDLRERNVVKVRKIRFF